MYFDERDYTEAYNKAFEAVDRSDEFRKSNKRTIVFKMLSEIIELRNSKLDESSDTYKSHKNVIDTLEMILYR